jgi:Holliday junction DNA helicase RuvA
MISIIEGKIYSIEDNTITVIANNIGFLIIVPDSNIYNINDNVCIEIFYHFSNTTGVTLFGFKNRLEKDIFKLIISCQGFGPKAAINILSHIDPINLYQAIKKQSIKEIQSISGIGKKKAETLIMHLKDKIDKLKVDRSDNKIIDKAEIIYMLKNLNYCQYEIDNAIEYINRNFNNKEYNIQDIIKNTILYLSNKK